MIVTKTFKGEDGNFRQWGMDWDNRTIFYKGLARDFQNMITVKLNLQSASELLESICREEGLSFDNVNLEW